MSRKSKITMLRDRLELLSGCPGDILNILDPSEEDIFAISEAERGDVDATRSISARLWELSKSESDAPEALFYFLTKGLELGDAVCAELAVRSVVKFNYRFELLETALAILGSNAEMLLGDVITMAKIKAIIYRADLGTAPEGSHNELLSLDPQMAEYLGAYLDAKAGADDAKSRYNTDMLKRAISLVDMDEWRDLWLIEAYEYSMHHLGGDLLEFADEMLRAIEARAKYPRRDLHILAFKRCLAELGVKYTIEECEYLEKLCRFYCGEAHLDTKEERDALIREAVYTSGKRERALCRMRSAVGAEMLHERNRYSLTMTLSNHQKRASRHQWESVISIRTNENSPPRFTPIPIVDRRAEIERNGVSLEKEKKLSQLFCKGELQLTDRTHPLELDLIIDISYVSATKCNTCEIRINRYKRLGDFIVMQVTVSVY